MTRRETVHSELSESEKRAALANDRRVHKGGSYHDFATSDASAVAGRYATEGRQRVVGSASFRYPELPETSPWHNDPVPAEEPLGVDINAVEAVGTHAEIEKSLAESKGGEGINLSLPPNGLPSGGDGSALSRGNSSSGKSKQQRRRRRSKQSRG
jgi:hypothetical protein